VRIGSDWNDTETTYIHFLVSDSGSGIADEDQDSLFTRFSQGAIREYTQYAGSGLGLYICRALVEIHGGKIGFRSTKGVGSAFGFYIKTRGVSQSPQNSESKPISTPVTDLSNKFQGTDFTTAGPTQSSTMSRGFHIVIVEDNTINQKVLSKQLRKAGHSIQIANHGQECLDILAGSDFCKSNGTKVSLVLMDIEMPVMNGIDCTKKIRRLENKGYIKGHVPIISTTGNARNEKVQLVKDAGVDDVILKPYSIPDLLRLIENLVQKYEVEESLPA